MNKICCSVAISSLYAENKSSSEMVSQILYGETAEMLECDGAYCKIKTDYDGTEAWGISQNFVQISPNELQEKPRKTFAESFGFYRSEEGEILLSIGSEIEAPASTKTEPTQERVAETAKSFLNAPYLKGGRSFFGVDADGFVQLVFKAYGIRLPRKASQQAEMGDVLFFAGESEMGDLAFFENENGEITHCGIMLNSYQIIHAFGKVRIDELDSSGIFNKKMNKHTHKLRFIRRVL